MRTASRRLRMAIPWLVAVVLAAGCERSAAESVQIPGANGDPIAVELHLPPDFDAETAYSVLVSPGGYYWQDRPSQPGWIVAVSDAFYGENRLTNSRRVLTWLREHYRVRHDGFHIAGWSANSAGVFEIAMTYPDDFLSVTGIAGMPGRGSEDAGKLRGVRVQFIVGENDSYWRRGSERWHQLLLAEGIRSTLEIIPGGDHVMPEIADEPIFERMNRLVAEIESSD